MNFNEIARVDFPGEVSLTRAGVWGQKVGKSILRSGRREPEAMVCESKWNLTTVDPLPVREHDVKHRGVERGVG